ncbi:hypothetical protein F4779DRAFT_637431 [Xylariaceae sp. FL0662B]|nr:hypothetical protein F4779DRAFT_637431 [Xylariaceae sp. FL0662B]
MRSSISFYRPRWRHHQLFVLPTRTAVAAFSPPPTWGRQHGDDARVRRPTTPTPTPTTRAYSSDSSPHYPDAPSHEHHHDLASYAAYAARTGLDTTSTLYVGTRYEYTVASALSALGFRDLRRVGGRSDCGIDLLGTWRLPVAPLRVLLQCKASAPSTKVGPHHVRELEGAFVGAPPGWRGPAGVLALLVAPRPATRGIRDALGRSRWPLGYVSCSLDGGLEQMIWNRRAEEEGLEGMGVGVQYYGDGDGGGGGPSKQRLVLTWKGKPYVVDSPSPSEPAESAGRPEQASE